MWQEVNSRVFTSNPDEIITSSMLRDAASRRWEEHSDVFEVPNMVMIVADRLVGCLEKLVRQHLGEFINEGRDLIGHAFPIESSYSVQTTTGQRNDIVCISCVTPVVEFSKALIQAAAILGSERIVNLLSGWKSGTPVTYRVCAILNGLFLEEVLEPVPGIIIEPLSLSTGSVFPGLAAQAGTSRKNLLGRALLSVEATAGPAFFRPGEEGSKNGVEAELALGAELETICQVLVLESDKHVEVGVYWNNFGALSALSRSGSHNRYRSSARGISPLPIGYSVQTIYPSMEMTLSLDAGHVSRLSEERVGEILGAISGVASQGTRVAVSRWCKSKESDGTIGDHFVDLRIALESLFLQDFPKEHTQEMRFRLALFGAWFLGSNFAERKEYRKTLRDAYDVASGAVHGREVKYDEKNLDLLTKSQVLCRKGIFKLLEEGPPDDWGDLVLGSSLQTGQIE